MGGSSKKVTVGYKYYLGMHMVLCHGPVDKISKIRVDNKVAWEDRSTGGTISINRESLFGGESREGGVSGTLSFLPGGPAQTANSYLVARLGSNVPAFRGVVSIVLHQMYVGMNPYLKRWGFRLTRIYQRQDGIAQWYPEKAGIAGARITRQDIVDLSAVTNAATSDTLGLTAGVTLSGYGPSDVVTVQPYVGSGVGIEIFGLLWFFDAPTWISFSPWGQPVLGGDNTGTVYNFRVIPGGVTADTDSYAASGGPYNGYEAARSAFISQFPSGVTLQAGEPSYTFYIFDNPTADNTGGVSLLVNCYEPEDMNPAHIIRECLTDPDWGMGYQEADIDDTSFEAAADTLYDEQMGISLLWDRQIPIEDFIKEVLKHISATLYVDRATGLFTLKLVRDDYDIETLLLLDEDNVDKVENPAQPQFGELTTSISVVYWDSANNVKATATIQDIALEQMQGAAINTTIQYPGFTNANIAQRAAQRDLITLSAALFSCTVYANRDAKDLYIGAVFKLTWPDYGINEMVMRVTGIAYGDGKNNRIRINCTQDSFALPTAAFTAPPNNDWEDPNAEPEPSEHHLAVELPYVEMVQRDGASSVNNSLLTTPEIGYAALAATNPGGSSINARLYTNSGAAYEEVGVLDFTPFALLAAAVPQEAGPTTVAIDGGIDLDSVALGTWAQIGTEIIEVTALSSSSITFNRGCLDTVPVAHADNSPIFFWDASIAADPTEYVSSDVIDMKSVTVAGSGELDIADAPEQTVTIVGRAARPYPPGNLIVDGTSYPTDVDFDFDIEWSHRDRLAQADQIIDTTETDIGPEAGTTYTVRLYLDDVLDQTFTGITDNFKNGVAVAGNGVVRVEVESVRDSLTSYQAIWAEFDYIGAVTFISTDVPDWSAGVAFSFTPTIVGGLAPFTWTVQSGSLPAGLSLNSSTGEISGTPTTAGTASYTLRVTDDNALFDDLVVSQDIAGDADWANVLLLVDATDKANGTTFTDHSTSARTLTTVGNAQILNNRIELDGSEDWITAPDHADWRFQSAGSNIDFTIEVFGVVFDAAGGSTNGTAQALISQYDAFAPATNQRGWTFSNSAGNLTFSLSTNGTSAVNGANVAWAPTVGQVYDIAITRSGSSFNLYVDGTRIATGTQAGVIFDSTSPLQIGARNTRASGGADTDDFDGRMKAYRITKVAKYTGASYTVPSIFPLPRATG